MVIQNFISHEYIRKILTIGKRGTCSSDEASYFEQRRPDIANLKHIFWSEDTSILQHFYQALGQEAVVEEGLVSLMVTFIKGCHIIELQCGGFGSTSATKQLLSRLESHAEAVELYSWIAANGGNYFIEAGVTYEENKKKEHLAVENRQRILENDQKIHLDAVARKEQHSDAHKLKSDVLKRQFIERTEKFQQMTESELIDSINANVKSPMTTDSQNVYRAALQAELDRRGYDYTAIGGKKYLLLESGVRLEGMNLVKDE